MLKTYGLIFADGRKELASVVLDEDGNPRIDTIRPYPLPDGWVDPRLVEVVKIDKPAEGEWEPVVVWFADRVERQWEPINN
jgi:hypothetical protein